MRHGCSGARYLHLLLLQLCFLRTCGLYGWAVDRESVRQKLHSSHSHSAQHQAGKATGCVGDWYQERYCLAGDGRGL